MNNIYGFSPGGNEPWNTRRAEDFYAAKTAGASWVRIDFNWEHIEPTVSGGYSWSAHDGVVADATAAGLKVLPILHTTPAWARAAGTSVHAPPTSTYFSRLQAYAQATVTRYAPLGLTTWQIGNEINLPKGTGYTPSGSFYNTNLLSPVAAAIRVVGNSLDIPLKTLLGSFVKPGTGAADPATMLTDIYNLGSGWLFDHISWHPYHDDEDPTTSTAMNSYPKALWDIAQTKGDGGMEIWATEYGMPTDGGFSYSEATQSSRLVAGLNYWSAKPYAGPIFVYSIRDRQVYGATTDREDYFGVLKNDGTRKTSYESVAGVMRG